MKDRLIALLTCELCHLEFELDLDFNIKKDGGIILSNLKCMNCQSKCSVDVMKK